MSLENIVNLVGSLNNMSAISSPSCMYFCKIQNSDDSICWGFLSPSDERLEKALVKVEVSIEEHQKLIAGGNIVYYDGEIFNADNDEYYLDENFDFVKKSKDEFNKIKADKNREDLVQKLYSMKSAKAYGGVVVNNRLVFETNQTSITNTVATLSLMDDKSVSNWKFYTIEGAPVIQQVNKVQLFAIASFGRQMIDTSFSVEGSYLTQLESATVQNLVSDEWIETFIQNAKNTFDEIENHLTVEF